MGNILSLGCKTKATGVLKALPISETGRANILKCFTDVKLLWWCGYDTYLDVWSKNWSLVY